MRLIYGENRRASNVYSLKAFTVTLLRSVGVERGVLWFQKLVFELLSDFSLNTICSGERVARPLHLSLYYCQAEPCQPKSSAAKRFPRKFMMPSFDHKVHW